MSDDKKISHLNEEGRAKMVDVSKKSITTREGVARALVKMKPETLRKIKSGTVKKGDVLAVSQVAGIMAAKKTSEIIPMCHPLQITGVDIKFGFRDKEGIVEIESTVKTVDRTGVEMEALVAVSACALTIYDMCKSIDRAMTIESIQLMRKSGGKSGEFKRE